MLLRWVAIRMPQNNYTVQLLVTWRNAKKQRGREYAYVCVCVSCWHNSCHVCLVTLASLSATRQSFSNTCYLWCLPGNVNITCDVYLIMSASLSATRQSFSSLTSRYSTKPSRRKSSKLLKTYRKRSHSINTLTSMHNGNFFAQRQ